MDHQSRPGVRPKKGRRDRLIQLADHQPTWTLGFVDEVWWSRVAQPTLHTWAAAPHPLRLVQQRQPPADPDPMALACYGVLLRRTGAPDRLWLRFVDGRPISAVTTQFLAWGSAQLAAEGQHVWVVVWDNAAWHRSKAVRTWVRRHNRAVKAGQVVGVRIVLCFLPVQSPWLNPIEPHWVHGKRRILEPARRLTADELEGRVCANFGCPRYEHLRIPADVA